VVSVAAGDGRARLRGGAVIAHPAQPSHAQAVEAQQQLDAAVAAILVARLAFDGRPTKALRAHISRQLAGVIASLETLRLALR
jgi:hypothetical protein